MPTKPKVEYPTGVITAKELMIASEQEIREELETAGVMKGKRIMRKAPTRHLPTASLVPTFNRPTLPSEVGMVYQRIMVRPFVPASMRCFRCLRFGHTTLRCRSAEEICSCGLKEHEPVECPEILCCKNCNGPQQARSNESTLMNN